VFGVRYGVSKLYAVIIAVVIVVAAVATVMYVTSPAPTPTPMTTQSPTTTPQVKEILVGVVMPFSGPAAVDGKINFQGIELAVDEINAQGGVKSLGGAKIKLVIGDSAGDPSTAAREAERLIAAETVVAVIGAY
jgi:branched-chain amino acid transport system substrate-binding protein